MSDIPATGPYHHGDLKNALLQAGERLLAEQGVAALNLRAVARVAGVSHAAPYRHFRDKAALLRGLALRGFADLEQAFTAAGIPDLRGPEQQLIESGVVYVRFACDHPGKLRLMSGGLIEVDGDALFRQAAGVVPRLLTEIVTRGRAQGLFRERDTGELVTLAWSAMHGLACLWMAGILPAAGGGRGVTADRLRPVFQNLIYGVAK